MSAKPLPIDDVLIDENDFKSIELQIDIINRTANTEVRDGKRIMAEESANLKAVSDFRPPTIVEFLDNGLVIEVPPQICAKGHVLGLEIKTKNVNPQIVFKPNLRVDKVENLPDGSEKLYMTFTRKNETEWQQFLGLFSKRQEEIFEFFRLVKP